MTYKVQITEKLQRIVEVEADSEEEAMDKVEDMWNCGDVILTADDFKDKELEVL